MGSQSLNDAMLAVVWLVRPSRYDIRPTADPSHSKQEHQQEAYRYQWSFLKSSCLLVGVTTPWALLRTAPTSALSSVSHRQQRADWLASLRIISRLQARLIFTIDSLTSTYYPLIVIACPALSLYGL